MRRRFAFLIRSGFFEIAMRGIGILAFLVLCAVQCLAADDKWVWGTARNANSARLLPGGKYAVVDNYEDSYNRPPFSSSRPIGGLPSLIRPVTVDGDNRLPPSIDRRPYPQGTGLGLGSYGELPSYPRPPLPPLPPPPAGGFGGRPPLPPAAGIDESYDPTKFKICKCTHSFNCRSPGILFGSCDAGKQYCCEKDIPPSRETGIPINDGSYPEVLAGPGGPVDHLRSVNQFGRSNFRKS